MDDVEAKPPLLLWLINALIGGIIGALNPIIAALFFNPDRYREWAEKFGGSVISWMSGEIAFYLMAFILPCILSTAVLYPFFYSSLCELRQASKIGLHAKLLVFGAFFGAACTSVTTAIILFGIGVFATIENPSFKALFVTVMSIPFSVVPSTAALILCSPAILASGYLLALFNFKIISRNFNVPTTHE